MIISVLFVVSIVAIVSVDIVVFVFVAVFVSSQARNILDVGIPIVDVSISNPGNEMWRPLPFPHLIVLC